MTDNKTISITLRATSSFLQAIPPPITHFDADIYVVVNRKEGLNLPEEKYGTYVRLDPVHFDWTSKTFTINIPTNINTGITSIDDMEENWFESVQAALLFFMTSSLS